MTIFQKWWCRQKIENVAHRRSTKAPNSYPLCMLLMTNIRWRRYRYVCNNNKTARSFFFPEKIGTVDYIIIITLWCCVRWKCVIHNVVHVFSLYLINANSSFHYSNPNCSNIRSPHFLYVKYFFTKKRLIFKKKNSMGPSQKNSKQNI